MYNQIKVSGKLFKFHKQRGEGASRLLKGSNAPPAPPAPPTPASNAAQRRIFSFTKTIVSDSLLFSKKAIVILLLIVVNYKQNASK